MQIRCAKDHVACEKTSVIRRYLPNSVAPLQGFRGGKYKEFGRFLVFNVITKFFISMGRLRRCVP